MNPAFRTNIFPDGHNIVVPGLSTQCTFPGLIQYMEKMVGAGLVYFRRFITLTAISSKPSLASPAGKILMDAIALSAYSCARARVCSNPSLLFTISRA